MNEGIRFVLSRITTRTFWVFVVTSFMGVLMFEMRSTYRDRIYQEAIADLKKQHWRNFRP